VADIAGLAGGNVICRPDRSGYAATDVTQRALGWSSAKHSIAVTGLAVQEQMRTGQRKTCGEMVEIDAPLPGTDNLRRRRSSLLRRRDSQLFRLRPGNRLSKQWGEREKQQRHENRGASQHPVFTGQPASCVPLIPHAAPWVGRWCALWRPNRIIGIFLLPTATERHRQPQFRGRDATLLFKTLDSCRIIGSTFGLFLHSVYQTYPYDNLTFIRPAS